MCLIKSFNFLKSFVNCQMLCLDFVGGRLYPNPRLRVFVTDSLKVILERFWNFVSGLVNFLGFFFCQFFVCD